MCLPNKRTFSTEVDEWLGERRIDNAFRLNHTRITSASAPSNLSYPCQKVMQSYSEKTIFSSWMSSDALPSPNIAVKQRAYILFGDDETQDST